MRVATTVSWVCVACWRKYIKLQVFLCNLCTLLRMIISYLYVFQLRYCLQYNESIVQQFIISLRDTDRKIMILPIIYLLLWVWHLLGNMLYIHIGMDSNNALSNMIMLLSVSVYVYLYVSVPCSYIYACVCILVGHIYWKSCSTNM